MSASKRDEELRRGSNPLFNDRKLKLGTFCTNLDYGAAITTIEGTLRISWPATLALAKLADEMEFEALVPVGRWRGFGGVTNFNGAGFECFSWAAGMAASTTYPAIFATSHVPTVHPIMAAKQGAAIDHISNGRFVLNVVTGWNLPEIEMFGVDMLDHDTRYERAAEWLGIIRRLWTEDGEFDFEGRFYKIKKGFLAPKPLQHPHPVIMNAGGSDTGRRFAAKHADVAFVNVTSHDFTEVKARMDAYRRDAREAQGHDIQVWTNCYVVQGETEKEAKDFARHYIDENGDWEAARTLVVDARHQFRVVPAGDPARDDAPLHRRLGRISHHRHQGADRRHARRAVQCRPRRRAADVGALRGPDARVQGQDPAAGQAGRAALSAPDMYLGIDIGGTFTDLVLMDDDGNISTSKAPTTPGELEKGVFDAVAVVADAQGLTPEALLGRVAAFGHGTTQATNALIERTGAVTGLITTRGFGDTLALQRLMGFTAGVPVEHLGWYSRRRYPDPIVPRRLVREVRERVDQAGRVLVALDEDGTRIAVRELLERGVLTFAVTLLWSFRNPAHERRIGEIIREMAPGAYVSLSCEVSPIIGEYERTATTVLNSYLAPKVADYLDRIENLLRDRGFRGKFNVLNSAGGVIPAREAARKPVLLVASGPAGGVMGSLQLAQEIGHHNVITTDMGGTSFDVALVVDGKPLVSGTHEAGGFHLNTPIIDIRAIGAGGGSIARVEANLLRVGPDSAGAVPGPVCYGRGGRLATVTDADLVLGILSPDNFLGGRMKLDRAAATEAIRAQIAEPLGMSVEAAAAGIRRVVDGHMADTLREVTIGRGHDPRDFVLLAYGGAGPAHCAGYGTELGVPRILDSVHQHGAFGLRRARLRHPALRRAVVAAARGRRHPRSLGRSRLRRHRCRVRGAGRALPRRHGAIGVRAR